MTYPMVKEIKRRGYQILITDGNPDCYCKPLADLFHHLNVYDVNANLKFAETIKDGVLGIDSPKAVLTIGTDAGPTASALSELFDLPGIPRKVAESVKDKGLMRQALKELPDQPGWVLIETEADCQNLREFESYPVVVKDRLQSGSRGIVICHNEMDTLQAIAAKKYNCLVEEMLQGADVTPAWRKSYGWDTSEAAFDFFVQDEKVHYANGALRMFYVDQPGIEAGHINPFNYGFDYHKANGVLSIAKEAAKALGVTWGPFKLDLKQDVNRGWCILEAATRLSGGWDHMYTAPLGTGKDITKAMLDMALGLEIGTHDLRLKHDAVAVCIAPRYEPGKIAGWTLPYYDFSQTDYIFRMTDDEIRPLTCNQDRPLFVVSSTNGIADEAVKMAMETAGQIRPNYI